MPLMDVKWYLFFHRLYRDAAVLPSQPGVLIEQFAQVV